MKVFASRYLEAMSSDKIISSEKWNWNPSNQDVKNIYACGAPTSTGQSTYAAEKDNRGDSDRPNEGMFIA